jgi:hypothetical protein
LADVKNEFNNPFVDFRRYEDPKMERIFECVCNVGENFKRFFPCNAMVLHSRISDNPDHRFSVNLRLETPPVKAIVKFGTEPPEFQYHTPEHPIPLHTVFPAVLVDVYPYNSSSLCYSYCRPKSFYFCRKKFMVMVSLSQADIEHAPRDYINQYYRYDPALDLTSLLGSTDEMDEVTVRPEDEAKSRFSRGVVHPFFRFRLARNTFALTRMM